MNNLKSKMSDYDNWSLEQLRDECQILEMCKSDPKPNPNPNPNPNPIRSDRIFSDFGSSKIISDRIGLDKVVL